MVDYWPIRSNNHKHLGSEPEPEADQEGQEPVVVDVVYNTHEAQNGKTIAIKVSIQLPLQA